MPSLSVSTWSPDAGFPDLRLAVRAGDAVRALGQGDRSGASGAGDLGAAQVDLAAAAVTDDGRGTRQDVELSAAPAAMARLQRRQDGQDLTAPGHRAGRRLLGGPACWPANACCSAATCCIAWAC